MTIILKTIQLRASWLMHRAWIDGRKIGECLTCKKSVYPVALRFTEQAGASIQELEVFPVCHCNNYKLNKEFEELLP